MKRFEEISIGVVIPWREQPSRIEGFNIVVSWYKKNMPKAKMYFPNHPGDVWLPSATRNDGVRMAEQDGCEVIIMNDADTIPDINALVEAVEAAFVDNFIHLGYTEFAYLTKRGSRDFISGKPFELCERNFHPYVNFGVNIFKPATWWSIGGMDEKFKEWGCEDTAMGMVHRVVKGREFVRHKGVAFSISHDPQPQYGNKNFENNRVLFERYCKADNPRDMLNIVKSTSIY